MHALALRFFRERDFSACRAALEAIVELGVETPPSVLLHAICLSELDQQALSKRTFERARSMIGALPRASKERASYEAFGTQAEQWIDRNASRRKRT